MIAPSAPEGEQLTPGPRAALSQVEYRRWFFAQIFSASGGTTQVIGQSWLITQATHSGFALAFLAVAMSLPSLVLGPWAGSVIDRHPRRVILIVTQLCFIAIGAVLLVSSIADGGEPLWLAYGAAVATGIVTAFDMPSRQVYVIELVDRRLLSASIGLYEVIVNSSRVLGPAVAGVILAVWGVTPCFAFNALAYLPTLLVLVLNRPDHVEERAAARRREGVSTMAGLRWVWSQPDVFWNIVLAAISCMIYGLTTTVPLMMTRVFGLGGGAYGIATAMFGLGALFGATRAATHPRPPTGRETRTLALITACVIIATCLSPNAWVFGSGIAVVGCFSILWIARANTLVQLRSPAHMRGRIMSIWSMAIPGMGPFMAISAGAAVSLDPRFGFGLSGVLFGVVGLVAWRAFRGRIRSSVDTESITTAG